eukprot:SAG11_NODE_136_length_15118_cov_14.188495_5_plen_65_part_00
MVALKWLLVLGAAMVPNALAPHTEGDTPVAEEAHVLWIELDTNGFQDKVLGAPSNLRVHPRIHF